MVLGERTGYKNLERAAIGYARSTRPRDNYSLVCGDWATGFDLNEVEAIGHLLEEVLDDTGENRSRVVHVKHQGKLVLRGEVGGAD